MQSDIDQREDYDIVRFLGKEMANDAAVAARIGDFCGVLAGLHYVGDLWARSCATTSGDNSSSNGSAALSAATSSRAFLPYADWLAHRNSVRFKPKT
jgi:hypothetical protein